MTPEKRRRWRDELDRFMAQVLPPEDEALWRLGAQPFLFEKIRDPEVQERGVREAALGLPGRTVVWVGQTTAGFIDRFSFQDAGVIIRVQRLPELGYTLHGGPRDVVAVHPASMSGPSPKPSP